MNRILSITALLCITLLSCEKLAMPEKGKTDPESIFAELWTGIDENYSLFGFTDVNWNDIRVKYSGKIYQTMTDEALYDTLNNMLFELEDAHSNIFSPERSIKPLYYYYYDTLLYPKNYNSKIVLNNYLYNNSTIVVHNGYGYCRLAYGEVGYMAFPQNFDDRTTNGDFVKMLDYFKDTKGLIIDIRQNGGGDNSVSEMMMSHFTNKKVLVSRYKNKNGPGHSDFTEWYTKYIEPASPFYSGKVVILTNRIVYSTANEMVLWAKSFPNITSVGGKTGGGIGVPTKRLLSNGWVYRVSASVKSFPNGTIPYSGIDPDVEVTATYANGKDEIIEKGIAIVLGE